jgi:ribonuclease HI/pterin-4a-carbinolamine dehydratase
MWQEKDDKLYQEFVFKDFNQAFNFMQSVAKAAEGQNHHPRWLNEWNKVEIWLSTHEAGNKVTTKDQQLAGTIDNIYKNCKKAKSDDKKTTKFKQIKLYADGGSRGNPGPSASGYVLFDMQDNILVEHGVYLGVTTNNQAEYQALKLALEEAKKLEVEQIHVYMDSLLVINQMLGKFKVSNRDLWPIHNAIKELVASLKSVSFTHIPRELNKAADNMVNRALDEQQDNSL